MHATSPTSSRSVRREAPTSSFRYKAQVRLAAELVAAGEIGRVLEIECVSHYDLNVLIPHSWSHLLAEGGGRLNNNLTHKLCKRLSQNRSVV